MEKNSESKFVKVACARCGNRQIIFGKSSTKVKCIKCNKLLTRSTGGKVRIRTRVQEVLQ